MNKEKFLQLKRFPLTISIARKMRELLFQASLKAFQQMAKTVKSCFCQPLSIGVGKSKTLILVITKEVININLSLESSQFFGVFPIEAKGSVPINYRETAFCGMSSIKTSVYSISKTLYSSGTLCSLGTKLFSKMQNQTFCLFRCTFDYEHYVCYWILQFLCYETILV